MRRHTCHRHPWPQRLLGGALLCLVAAAHAEPAAPADAMLNLLQERGVQVATTARADAQHLARQVRNGAAELVLSAMNFLGVPYRRGGSTPEQGFDCSGFTRHIFEASIGLVLPHRADEQARQAGLQKVTQNELKPGDLVFFNTMRRAFSHVGIYIGEGRFIHAPRSGTEVRVDDMRNAYWTRRFNGARRADIAPPAPVAKTAASDATEPSGSIPNP